MESLSQLGARQIGDELKFVLPAETQFTAASLNRPVASAGTLGIAEISFSAEHGGVIVHFPRQPTAIRLRKAWEARLDLRVDAQPSEGPIEALAVEHDCHDNYVIFDPQQVFTARQLMAIIDQFTGKLAVRSEDWIGIAPSSAFMLTHVDDGYAYGGDIPYEAIVERIPLRYATTGKLRVDCGFSHDDGKLAELFLSVFALRKEVSLDTTKAERMAGISSVRWISELQEVKASYRGPVLGAYGDTQMFAHEVQKLVVAFAKTLGVYPTSRSPLSIKVTPRVQLQVTLDIESDPPAVRRRLSSVPLLEE